MKCWFRHQWKVHQYAVTADGTGLGRPGTFVIAWKQCARCAKSKLVHILT